MTEPAGTEPPETEPKRPAPKPGNAPDADVDKRANEAFLDTIFDTDGKPNSEAESVVETEGFDDDEEDR